MLKLNNISKTFNLNTANEQKALDNINLSIPSGDFVTVIGGNGAGKSTLLNAISGIFLVDNGRILVDNNDFTFMREYKRSRKLGRLFQDPLKGTAPGMTIAENLALAYMRASGRGFSIGISGKDKGFFKKQLRQLNLGLEDRLDAKMGLLSGGQRQAVTLLMATMIPPKLLMLDEHTAALDPDTAQKVIMLTEDIVRRNNITTVMITHNISSALTLGNRTIMLDEGKIILDVSGEERKSMTVESIMEIFRQKNGKELDNDRMLLQKERS